MYSMEDININIILPKRNKQNSNFLLKFPSYLENGRVEWKNRIVNRGRGKKKGEMQKVTSQVRISRQRSANIEPRIIRKKWREKKKKRRRKKQEEEEVSFKRRIRMKQEESEGKGEKKERTKDEGIGDRSREKRRGRKEGEIAIRGCWVHENPRSRDRIPWEGGVIIDHRPRFLSVAPLLIGFRAS